MLMINNHFKLFQLPGNLSKTKKMCSLFPWQHVIPYLFDFKILLHHHMAQIQNHTFGQKFLNRSFDFKLFYEKSSSITHRRLVESKTLFMRSNNSPETTIQSSTFGDPL
jgi:hypothetical protein